MRDRFAPLHPNFQPLLFLAAALALGILAGRTIGVAPKILAAMTALAWLVCLLNHLGKLGRNSTVVPLLLVGFFLAGALHFHVEEKNVREDSVRRLYEQGKIVANDAAEFVGVLVVAPEEAPSGVYLDLQVEEVRAFKQTHRASGRARVTVNLADEEARRSYDKLLLGYGVRVRVMAEVNPLRRFANPGSPDYSEYLERRGYSLSGTIKSQQLVEALVYGPPLIEVLARDQGSAVLTVLYDLKHLTEKRIDRVFSEPTSGILKALLLGNQNYVDRPTAERFRAGGTFHVLVISGFHIALIAGLIVWWISKYTGNWWVRSLPTIIALWLYALVVGTQAPVFRAAVMMTALLTAPLVFRQAPAVNSLGLAAMVLLVLDPSELFSPSFQLTVLAVAGLVLIALPLMSRLKAIGEWQPRSSSPQPPRCSRSVRWLAEILFWDERGFQREQDKSPIRFKLDKADLALALNRIRGLQPAIRYLSVSLIVSFIIQIVMAPVMAEYFHRVVAVGILLNILISVLVAVLGVLAIIVLTVSLFSVHLAGWMAQLAQSVTTLMVSSFDWPLKFRLSSFRVPDYSGPAVLIYVGFFVALVYFAYVLSRWQPLIGQLSVARRPLSVVGNDGRRTTDNGRKPLLHWLATGVPLASFILIVAHPVGHSYQPGSLTIHFLDVGNGDCALVEFPDGKTMLVDAGGERRRGNQSFIEDTMPIGEAVVSNFLWSRGIKRIDYIVPTHADADHIEGFLQVVKNFQIGRAVFARLPRHEPLFRVLMQELQAAKVPIQTVEMGDKFQISGVKFTVLWPPRINREPPDWGNHDSLALRLTYGDHSILLAADIEQAAEQALVASGFDLRSDVLKVPHHGSPTSSTEEFIKRVAPRSAIISASGLVSQGEFQPIDAEIIERYRRFGAEVFQTSRSGIITVATDGRTITIRTFNP
jgi:competence protein ComEC